jgi:hypothetical protein
MATPTGRPHTWLSLVMKTWYSRWARPFFIGTQITSNHQLLAASYLTTLLFCFAGRPDD